VGTNSKPAARDAYLVKSVVHASQLLLAFRSSGEALPLREISARSGLPKSMAFRLLYTLERCGMIEKVGENLYRSFLRPFKQRPYRLGYAAQGTDYQFSKESSTGLKSAAAAGGMERTVVDNSDNARVMKWEESIERISVDNRYNAKIAQRNADVLVREKVDLVIEFQTDEHVAPIVAAKYREAGIPLVAIEVPHPGATYFGANNYEAGLLGGRHLGRWAKQQRCSDADEIVLMALNRAGSLPKMRLTGMLVGMKEIYPQLDHCKVTYLDGDGTLGESFEVMRKHLRISRARKLLIGAINDPSALGALRAMQEVGRTDTCAVMGQNASPEGRAELRQRGTRLIGSVAYFPEKYGAEIVAVALDILHRRPVPPAVFVKHQLVTPENVDHIYPNDHLIQITEGTLS
jgi:ribose transport system substrate-binding protein